jgi:DNA-binding NtrC family response regulator
LGKSVVLVVEDEAIIRMATVQMVEDAGYAVLYASNTKDALTILEDRCDIRVVFTEVRVPGRLNGMDLGRTIAERWPLVRLIMTSGIPKADNFPLDWRFIPKPYDSAQIAAALRALVVPYLTVVS